MQTPTGPDVIRRGIGQFILLSVVLASGCDTDSGWRPSGSPAPIRRTTIVDGVEREYFLYGSLEQATRGDVPLVFNLHSTSGTPHGQMRLSGWAALIEKNELVVVAPTGVYIDYREKPTWNADMDPNGVDDVGFIRQLVETLPSELGIDRKRVYVLGYSAGARLASRLACEMPEMIAAVAAVAGVQYPDTLQYDKGCGGARPVPLLAFHGTEDHINDFYHQGSSSPRYWKTGVEEAIRGWVLHNGCDGPPSITMVADHVSRESYGPCADNTEVVFYRVVGRGHEWPSLKKRRNALLRNLGIGAGQTSQEIWEFFKRHSLE